MNIALVTNEYPPHIYGGAGVHVEHLSRELMTLDGGEHVIKVLCFGEQQEHEENLQVQGLKVNFSFPFQKPHLKRLMDTIYRNIMMAGSLEGVDVIHCHTWYTALAGCLLKQLLGKPLILTTHSLEPHRPWKAEQLGAGYQVSTWLEKTAYQNADGVIAVSRSMREDVHELYGVPLDRVRVIYNGIDVNRYQPVFNQDVLQRYEIDGDRPYILFVGRITHQKGIIHLLKAAAYFPGEVQLVLCATDPDTPEIGQEMTARVRELVDRGRRVIWISQFVPAADIVPLYSQAALFVCPSIYEPFGIINLEAMACGVPVVGSAVGGIPEVVVDQETGILVPMTREHPEDHDIEAAEAFARRLAEAVNYLLANPAISKAMGLKARRRVQEKFSWHQIARQTVEFYRELEALSGSVPPPGSG